VLGGALGVAGALGLGGRMVGAGVWQRPALLALGCVLGLGGLLMVRPDGRVHLDVLSVAPGQAVLIRGPTGRTVLVGRGRLNARELASEVAVRLAVWEHGLDAALDLDDEAAERMRFTLERYPATQHLDAAQDARLDLGGGAALDVYAQTPSEPGVGLSFGATWVRVLGKPPPPTTAPDGGPPLLFSGDADLVLNPNGLERGSGQARPLLQPDQQHEIEHDHQKHDDQLHPFADDHRPPAP
jgi:hypothetical protein